MLRFIAATIAFPPCFPTSFKTLHETAKKILTEKYNDAEKICTERAATNPRGIGRCGDTIGWMINFMNNINSPTNINIC